MTDSEIEIVDSTSTTTSFTMIDEDVTVTAKFKESEPAIWIPMQAEIHDGTKIDFYPAFSETSQIAGYKFATYY